MDWRPYFRCHKTALLYVYSEENKSFTYIENQNIYKSIPFNAHIGKFNLEMPDDIKVEILSKHNFMTIQKIVSLLADITIFKFRQHTYIHMK